MAGKVLIFDNPDDFLKCMEELQREYLMKQLFFWLICNTSIDKFNQITNNDIKKYFLEVYPDCNTSNLNGLIGMFLYSIYGNDLIKRVVGNSTLYNLRVYSKPVKEIFIRKLE